EVTNDADRFDAFPELGDGPPVDACQDASLAELRGARAIGAEASAEHDALGFELAEGSARVLLAHSERLCGLLSRDGADDLESIAQKRSPALASVGFVLLEGLGTAPGPGGVRVHRSELL